MNNNTKSRKYAAKRSDRQGPPKHNPSRRARRASRWKILRRVPAGGRAMLDLHPPVEATNY